MTLNEVLDFSLLGISVKTVLGVIFVVIAGMILGKILCNVAARALERRKTDAALSRFLITMVKLLVRALTLLIALDILGIPMTSVVAALGVAGLALSLALQDILSNVFSGMTVLISRPFSSGDFVELAESSGEVTDIGLFYTSIITPDKKIIHIPNKDVCSSRIINATENKQRRIDINIGVSYDCAPSDVRAALLRAAEAESRLLPEPAPAVLLSSYASSNIQYILRCWTNTEDYWDTLYALNESCGDYLTKAGLSMAYEHIDLRIIKD